MNEEIKMGVYDKKTNELEDFGVYENIKEALDDLINYDIPKGRYGIIEGYGRFDTESEVNKLLKQDAKSEVVK